MTQRSFYETSYRAGLKQVSLIRNEIGTVLTALKASNSEKNALTLCFTELANNAIIHGHATGMHLTLKQQNSDWCLVVNDDGIQWPDQIITTMAQNTAVKNSQANVISPLFIENTTLDKTNGRGLSLISHLSKTINYSRDEESNIIEMTFPKTAKNKKTLLLVEDESSLRQLYKTYLSDCYTIIEASDGQQAFTILKNEHVDMVLADINMPIINGVELLNKINADNDIAIVPFIFITGESCPSLLSQVNYLGTDLLLKKPIDKTSLLAQLDQANLTHQRLKQRLNGQFERKISACLAPTINKKLPLFNISSQYRNAYCGGGDFVISHHVNDKHYLVIADVMGHDCQAKFFAHCYFSYIRGLLVSLSKEKASCSVGSLLSQLSNFVYGDKLGSQAMLSCQILCLHDNGNIDIASAGHPAPIIIDDTGESQIAVGGTLLGLLPEQPYTPITFTLKPNQQCILYTDGLFDSALDPDNLDVMSAAIKQTLLYYQDQDIQLAADKAMRQFDLYSGSPAKDDALLLLLRSTK